MAPLIEEPDHTTTEPATDPPQDRVDEFLRGLVAGVTLTCLAVLIVAGSIAAGLR